MIRQLALIVVISTIAFASIWCGGVTTTTQDGGGTDGSSDDAAFVDASSDAWWARFDAQPFADHKEPELGEIPPNSSPNNGRPCDTVFGTCVYGLCDIQTGWCCRGNGNEHGVCMCGAELGCQSPFVCCTGYEGGLQPKCIEGWKCPDYPFEGDY